MRLLSSRSIRNPLCPSTSRTTGLPPPVVEAPPLTPRPAVIQVSQAGSRARAELSRYSMNPSNSLELDRVYDADDGGIDRGPGLAGRGGRSGPPFPDDHDRVADSRIDRVESEQLGPGVRAVGLNRLDDHDPPAFVPLVFLRGNRVSTTLRRWSSLKSLNGVLGGFGPRALSHFRCRAGHAELDCSTLTESTMPTIVQ